MLGDTSMLASSIRPLNAREWGLLVLLSLVWGGSFFFAKIAVQEIAPLSVTFGRVFLAALALLVTLKVMGMPLPRGRAVWFAFFGMGVLNNVIPFSLLFWSQTQIGAGLASILNATTPVATVLVLHALSADEKITAIKLAGVLIGFAGASIMIGPDILLSGLDKSILAQIACLGAAVSYGFAGWFGRRFARLGVTPLQTAFGQVCASSLMMLPVMLIADTPWRMPMPGLASFGAVLGLALISTAFAYVLFFRLLASAGATNLGMVTLLVPISALALGILFLGEVLTFRQIAGMVLIAMSLIAIDGRLYLWLIRRNSSAGQSEQRL